MVIRIFIISLLFIQLSVYSQSKQDYKELHKYIENAVDKFEVPGFAVGIVKDGKLVFENTYGERNTETGDKVTPETMFGIASCSKAFTANCLGILVDEGKISWEDKVIDHYPEFQMYDPYITSEMQIQDLLSHRSGLQTFDGDLLWYGTSYSREEVVQRIKFRKNPYSFRSQFGYQNVMYIAAGVVIKKVTGKTWDEFVTERIFEPLAMNSTNTTNSTFTESSNVSAPHQDGKPMGFIDYDNSGPAASMNTSVHDMTAWLNLWLNKGTYNEEQIFSESYYYKATTPLITLNAGRGEQIDGTHFYGYGLGWFLFDFEGRKIIQHGGGLPGVHSKVVLVPEDSLAYVIIANQISGLVESVHKKILDFHLNDSEQDWAELYFENEQKSKVRSEKQETAILENRITGTSPSLELANYVGTYEDEMYGQAEVSIMDGVLNLTLLPTKELFTADMEHWHYDTFKVTFNDPFLPSGYVTFNVNGKGHAENFTIDLKNPDFHFYKLDFKKVKTEK